jgi:polyhydroxybutyrate depolymerase
MQRFFFAAMASVLALSCSDDDNKTDGKGTTVSPGDGGAPESGTVQDSGAEPPPQGGFDVTAESIDVNGQSRGFTLVVPTTYDAARAYPLVLAFHGDGGDGASFRSYYAIENASGDDAIVAYPTGLGQSWQLYEQGADNVDVPFVEALVLHLAERLSIDTARVFGTGWSKGAFFVNQFACRKSGVFRAISAHAGGAPYEPNGAGTWESSGYVKCNDEQTGTAAFVTHGTNDGAVDPKGGAFAAEYWRAVNGCQNTREPTTPAPCVAYAGCPSDKRVVWCEIAGQGHGIWSQGASATWAFFSSL